MASRWDDLTVRFCKAFYGGGTNWDRSVMAWEMSDYIQDHNPYVARLYEYIGEYYSKLSLEENKSVTNADLEADTTIRTTN